MNACARCKFEESRVKRRTKQSLTVVTTSVVVSSILLASDELFGVEQLSVSASSNLVNDRGFQIDENSARNVLATSSLCNQETEISKEASNACSSKTKRRKRSDSLTVPSRTKREAKRTREESVEGIVFLANRLVIGHQTVRLDSMLQAVPAGQEQSEQTKSKLKEPQAFV